MDGVYGVERVVCANCDYRGVKNGGKSPSSDP